MLLGPVGAVPGPGVTEDRKAWAVASEEEKAVGGGVGDKFKSKPAGRTIRGVLLGPVGPVPRPGVILDIRVLRGASHPAEEDHVVVGRVVGQAGKASPRRVVLGVPLGPVVAVPGPGVVQKDTIIGKVWTAE